MKPVPRVDEKILQESKKAHAKDVLANDEPTVLESSAADPEFPAMQEFEVDTDGPAGSKSKHPGLIWAIIAIVAVIVLIIAFMVAGDWATPNQAQEKRTRSSPKKSPPKTSGPTKHQPRNSPAGTLPRTRSCPLRARVAVHRAVRARFALLPALHVCGSRESFFSCDLGI